MSTNYSIGLLTTKDGSSIADVYMSDLTNAQNYFGIAKTEEESRANIVMSASIQFLIEVSYESNLQNNKTRWLTLKRCVFKFIGLAL